MLVRNGRSIFQNPGRFSGVVHNQTGNYIKGGMQNRSVGAFSGIFSAFPNGTSHPSAFILPVKGGSLASYGETSISLTQNTVILIRTWAMVGSSAITITLTNATLASISPLIASSTIVVSSGSAALAAAVAASATGSITVTVGTAELGGIFDVSASSTITTTSLVQLTALAFMEASAGGPTELSPEGLAAAVWNAVLTEYQNAGSTGEALGNASSAGNPWDAALVDNNDSGTFGERVQKLLKTSTFLGLK